jgi:hypothetical protein
VLYKVIQSCSICYIKIRENKIWLQFLSLYMLCFYLFPYSFLQRTVQVNHFLNLQIFFYSLYWYTILYRFHNIILFSFLFAVTGHCKVDEDCVKKYICPSHLNLVCVHIWCECRSGEELEWMRP